MPQKPSNWRKWTVPLVFVFLLVLCIGGIAKEECPRLRVERSFVNIESLFVSKNVLVINRSRNSQFNCSGDDLVKNGLSHKFNKPTKSDYLYFAWSQDKRRGGWDRISESRNLYFQVGSNIFRSTSTIVLDFYSYATVLAHSPDRKKACSGDMNICCGQCEGLLGYLSQPFTSVSLDYRIYGDDESRRSQDQVNDEPPEYIVVLALRGVFVLIGGVILWGVGVFLIDYRSIWIGRLGLILAIAGVCGMAIGFGCILTAQWQDYQHQKNSQITYSSHQVSFC